MPIHKDLALYRAEQSQGNARLFVGAATALLIKRTQLDKLLSQRPGLRIGGSLILWCIALMSLNGWRIYRSNRLYATRCGRHIYNQLKDGEPRTLSDIHEYSFPIPYQELSLTLRHMIETGYIETIYDGSIWYNQLKPIRRRALEAEVSRTPPETLNPSLP